MLHQVLMDILILMVFLQLISHWILDIHMLTHIIYTPVHLQDILMLYLPQHTLKQLIILDYILQLQLLLHLFIHIHIMLDVHHIHHLILDFHLHILNTHIHIMVYLHCTHHYTHHQYHQFILSNLHTVIQFLNQDIQVLHFLVIQLIHQY